MPQKRSQYADKELLVVLFKINIITASENIYLIFLSDCFIYIVLGFVSFLFAFIFSFIVALMLFNSHFTRCCNNSDFACVLTIYFNIPLAYT